MNYQNPSRKIPSALLVIGLFSIFQTCSMILGAKILADTRDERYQLLFKNGLSAKIGAISGSLEGFLSVVLHSVLPRSMNPKIKLILESITLGLFVAPVTLALGEKDLVWKAVWSDLVGTPIMMVVFVMLLVCAQVAHLRNNFGNARQLHNVRNTTTPLLFRTSIADADPEDRSGREEVPRP